MQEPKLPLQAKQSTLERRAGMHSMAETSGHQLWKLWNSSGNKCSKGKTLVEGGTAGEMFAVWGGQAERSI